jgi:putative NADPH-quinone reductase
MSEPSPAEGDNHQLAIAPGVRRALVILAHPCADSYGTALAHAAVDGLRAGGAHVDLLDLYALNFAAVMSPEERRAYMTEAPILDPMVAEHARLLKAAHTLVVVYPTWWSGPPAILKGWMERVMVSGVSFHIDPTDHRIRRGLTNMRRVIGISTYGSPRTYVRAINDNGRRIFTRSMRLAAGFRLRTTWLGLYAIDTATESERVAFLTKVRRELERAV